jgi:stearoyl-CoA desaturase (delta-9 desaturase)
MAWYEFDLNWVGIWLLSKLGLAWKVKVARFDRDGAKTAET